MSSQETAAEQRAWFLGRLRQSLVAALNGHTVTAADAWDILREWTPRSLNQSGSMTRFLFGSGEATPE